MPHRDARGYTLIELLIVMVIIGILASIATHQVQAKKHAYIATMKSDLRNMMVLQEAYFDDNTRYASNTNQLGFDGTQFTYEVLVGHQGGWTARVSHRILTDHQCAIYVGDVTPFTPATEEAVIACSMGSPGGGGGSKKGG